MLGAVVVVATVACSPEQPGQSSAPASVNPRTSLPSALQTNTAPPPPDALTALVVNVIDGDTIRVDIDGHVEVVRYLMRKGTKISAEWLVKLASKN